MAERRLQNELDFWFPRIESIPLLSEKKLEELQRKLYSSAQWEKFKHKSYGAKGTRLNLSNFTEKVIPWIHFVFEDNEFKYEENTFTNHEKINSKSAIIGNALHEAVSLFDLYRYGKTSEEDINNSFPSQNWSLIIPFLKALNNGSNDVREIWRSFHTDESLVDRSKYILSEEFGKLPLSVEKDLELKIRKSEETYELGLKLAKNFPESKDSNLTHFSETLAIFNFTQLSPNGQSRLQIPIRFDEIISETKTNNRVAYHFFDLKTGKQINDWPHQFQSLLMEFLAGHFVDQFFEKGNLPNINEPFITPPIRNILPHEKEISFQFGYFNKNSGDIAYVPVIQNYKSREGELFLSWLAFYSDATNALKKELSEFLKYDKPIDKKTLRYYQPELPKSPTYVAGFSHTSERCDLGGCGKFLNQICTPRQKGEKKTLIWISLECPIHGNRSFEKKFVPNEEIFYPKFNT